MITKLKFYSLFLINIFLYPIEKLLIIYYKNKPVKYPPIFIIGAPRTGSTIFYQYITNYFDIYYPNNFVDQFYKIPILATLIHKYCFLKSFRKRISFKSQFGQTKGYYGPSEFGLFFYRWIPKNKYYVDANDLSQQSKSELKASVIGMQYLMKKPIIFKNLNCGQRIKLLTEIFPNAIFIFCKRNILNVAHSILKGRQKVLKNVNSWWSIKPKELNEIKDLPYHEQIIKQIFYLEKRIYNDLKRINKKQHLVVNYKEFCKNPESIAKKVDFLFHKNKIPLTKVGKIDTSYIKKRGHHHKSKDSQIFMTHIKQHNWKTYEKIDLTD